MRPPSFDYPPTWRSVAGVLDAQVQVSICFERGQGTEVDAVESFRWCLQAAKKSVFLSTVQL